VGKAIALGLGATFLVLLTGGIYGVALAVAVGFLAFLLTLREERSRARIAQLEHRLRLLESGVPPSTAPAAPSAPPATAPPPPPVWAPPTIPAAAPTAPAWAPTQPPQPPQPPSAIELYIERLRTSSSAELEQLVAGRLLPIVGGVALIAAAIFFLGLAFSRGWIGEEGRVLIGLVAGVGAFGGGAVLLDRGQPIIGHILVGVGLGVVSLALFGATQLYGLVAPEVGVLGALVADLSAAAVAIRYRSQLVAGLGLVTALAAPPLMGASATIVTLVFLGTALVATTAIAIARAWRWLPAAAFVLTAPQLAAYVLGLPASSNPPWDAVTPLVVVLGFGVLNAVAAAGEEWRVVRHELSPTSAGLLVASAGFVVWAVLLVLADDVYGWEGLVVLGIGLGYLGLGGYFLRRGGDWHPFGLLAFGTGVAAVTLAVPLQLDGAPVPMIWAAEALALTWVYVTRRHPISGLGATGLALLAAGHLMFVGYALSAELTPGAIPFANPAGLALGWVVACGIAAMILVRTQVERALISSALVVLVTWAVPHEFASVTRVWVLGLVAVLASTLCWRWVRVDIDEAFRVPTAAHEARYVQLLAVAAPATVAYGLSLAQFLSPAALSDLPAVPFTDLATAAAAGLVVTGLGAGAVSDWPAWRAGSVILAAATAAYLLPLEIALAWVVVGWAGLAAVLFAVERWRLPEPALRWAGDILGAMSILLLLTAVLPPTSLLASQDGIHAPVLHPSTAATLAVIGLLALRAWLATDPRQRRAAVGGTAVASVYLLSVTVVTTVEYVAGATVGPEDLWYIGQVALSVCWATLGLGALIAGLAVRSLPVRVSGLILLGLATVKVFVLDMASLDIAFRVLSFVGLGLLLLGAGWIYLRLQGRTVDRPAG